ncbi:MAG TPA: sigma-70 family RNA polymerase sigma factor [Acidimicrobiales bacterium]|nr:sigma-70 family RNA polymerase sigma factor [Acidimicrobiales bacterium]
METAPSGKSLDAARAGDEWATTCLFRESNPALLRFLRHHAPDVAEDLLAETWLAAARQLPKFQGDADDFRAWLFTVARRRVADHYRRRHRRPRLVELEAQTLPPAGDRPEESSLDALSAQSAIEALVRDLPPDQAEVVLLRVVADLSVDQVADIMGRSPGSVRVLQHRALRHLETRWTRDAVTQ